MQFYSVIPMQALPKQLSFGAASTCGFLLISTALASIVVYKPYGVKDSQRGEYEQVLSDIRLKAEIANNKSLTELPSAHVSEPVHYFGNMAPQSSDSHSFRIDNNGKAPLTLQVVGTTCKCATGKLTNEILMPGEFSMLDVTWNTGQPGESYLQTVSLKSNDPAMESIDLTVKGEVYSELVVPDVVTFPKSDLGATLETEFLVHSQIYNDISVVSLTSDLSSFEWSAEPGTETDSELLHDVTKSVVKLKLKCKPTKRGEFASTATLTLLSDSGESIERSISLRGKVRANINFYSSEIYANSGLDMGTMTSGVRKEFSVVVRCDDETRELEVLRVEPPEVKATMTRMQKSGAHRLLIYVPEDCPTVVFNLNSKLGYVEVGDPKDKSYSNWLPIYGAVAQAAE